MIKKIKTNYNISECVIAEFNQLAKEKAINKSGLLEILILEWIKNNKNEQNKV